MATNDYADIYNTYANQRFNRIDRRTLTRAVKPYAKQKITLASAVGKSDQQLRAMAAKAVIAKFRLSKAGKKAAPKQPKAGTVTIQPRRVASSQRTGSLR